MLSLFYSRGASMSHDGPAILEGIETLRRQFAEVLNRVLPEDLTARAVPQLDAAFTSLLERFQLVPRDEFEQYLALLNRLGTEVEELSNRVAQLEAVEPGSIAPETDEPDVRRERDEVPGRDSDQIEPV